jgi:hypothetical protein
VRSVYRVINFHIKALQSETDKEIPKTLSVRERLLLAQSGRSHAKEHPSPVWSLQGRRRESDHRQDAAVDD